MRAPGSAWTVDLRCWHFSVGSFGPGHKRAWKRRAGDGGRRRRAEGIDVVILAGREPDRIDHERVPALVMADGFAEPGRLHIFRMLVGEIDAAHEMIALPYHPDFVRRLEEIHGLEEKELARHAPRPAARLG